MNEYGSPSGTPTAGKLKAMEWEDFYGSTINLLDGFLEYLRANPEDIAADEYVAVSSNLPAKKSLSEDSSPVSEEEYSSMNNYISLKTFQLSHSDNDSSGSCTISQSTSPKRQELCPVSESSPLQTPVDDKSKPPSPLDTAGFPAAHSDRPQSIISTSSSSTSSLPRSHPKYLSLDVGHSSHSELSPTMGVPATHKRSTRFSDPTGASRLPATSRHASHPHTAPTPRKGDFDSDAYFANRVITELLQTEKTYVQDLKDIAVGYKEYMANHQIFGFKERDFETIFINIADVYQFNKSFLLELEKCCGNVRLTAKCFVNEKDGFSVYEDYCTMFPKALKRLTTYMKWNRMRELFRECQHQLHHSLPLGSYLLKPVQRILKYRLLLQNLLKYTPASTESHSTVSQAVDCMTEIAERINEMKRRHEKAVRAQEIQSLLSGWEGPDLSTCGDLVFEDQLREGKSTRDAFLFEKVLIIAKRKKEQFLYFNYKGAFWMAFVTLTERLNDSPTMFSIADFRDLRTKITLEASCERQKELWCIELKRLIVASSDSSTDLDNTISGGSSSDSEDLHMQRQASLPGFFRQRFRRKSITNILGTISRSKSTRKQPRKKITDMNRSNPELSIHSVQQKPSSEQMKQILKETWFGLNNSEPKTQPSTPITPTFYTQDESPFCEVYVRNGRVCRDPADIMSPAESDTSSQISEDSDSESIYDSLDEISDGGSSAKLSLLDEFHNVPFIDTEEYSMDDHNRYIDRVSGVMCEMVGSVVDARELS